MVNKNCSKISKSRNKKTTNRTTKKRVGGNGSPLPGTKNVIETNNDVKHYIDLISFFSAIKDIIFDYFNYVLDVIIEFFRNVDNNNSNYAIPPDQARS